MYEYRWFLHETGLIASGSDPFDLMKFGGIPVIDGADAFGYGTVLDSLKKHDQENARIVNSRILTEREKREAVRWSLAQKSMLSSYVKKSLVPEETHYSFGIIGRILFIAVVQCAIFLAKTGHKQGFATWRANPRNQITSVCSAMLGGPVGIIDGLRVGGHRCTFLVILMYWYPLLMHTLVTFVAVATSDLSWISTYLPVVSFVKVIAFGVLGVVVGMPQVMRCQSR